MTDIKTLQTKKSTETLILETLLTACDMGVEGYTAVRVTLDRDRIVDEHMVRTFHFDKHMVLTTLHDLYTSFSYAGLPELHVDVDLLDNLHVRFGEHRVLHIRLIREAEYNDILAKWRMLRDAKRIKGKIPTLPHFAYVGAMNLEDDPALRNEWFHHAWAETFRRSSYLKPTARIMFQRYTQDIFLDVCAFHQAVLEAGQRPLGQIAVIDELNSASMMGVYLDPTAPYMVLYGNLHESAVRLADSSKTVECYGPDMRQVIAEDLYIGDTVVARVIPGAVLPSQSFQYAGLVACAVTALDDLGGNHILMDCYSRLN